MQISFIILFMIDLFKDNHMHVFVNFFFEKLLLRNYWLDFYQISQEFYLEVKNFSSPLQKNQAPVAIQTLKHLLLLFCSTSLLKTLWEN